MIGQTLSHFRITAKLGEGGMGEVYRAEDTKLGRDVAIKVLPDAFTEDPERFARFEREAKLLASLNHPGIAGIHDLAEDQGTHFLVLELAEGQDLASHLAGGPIPAEEALPIALQIAQALEAAHDKGIVHRDLKPANIMISPDGQAKVLDFGLAKAFASDPGESPSILLSQSPTMAAGETQAGVILGTAAYMSPEQAKGKPVDKRSDIWAFGVVLFEMLSGRRLFEGETLSDILAAVLRAPIEPSRLPEGADPRLRRLLDRCLVRDPAMRMRDIGEARILLSAAEETGQEAAAAAEGRAPRFGAALPWGLALAALIAALIAWSGADPEPVSQQQSVRFTINSSHAGNAGVAVSPDGRRLAFRQSERDFTGSLWVRSLDDLTPVEIAGTANNGGYFWSPDGRELAFYRDERLMARDVDAGSTREILSGITPFRGGTWGEKGVILLSMEDAIYRVPASGGSAQLLLAPEEGEASWHTMPSFLPGGERFFFTSEIVEQGNTMPAVQVAELSDPSQHRTLIKGALNARWSNGHIVYTSDDFVLIAQRADPESLVLTGPPVEIGRGMLVNTRSGFSGADASANGVLAYRTSQYQEAEFVWFSATGQRLSKASKSGTWHNFDLSPDGQRITTTARMVGAGNDLWIIEPERGIESHVDQPTYTSVSDPTWSPDSRELAFRLGNQLVTRAAQGGEVRVILDERAYPDSWSLDGKWLAYGKASLGRYDLFAIALDEADPEPILLVKGEPSSDEPRFSPNGSWVAYATQQDPQVFAIPFPPTGERWQLSSSGGVQPRWSRDGNTLFYLEPGGRLMRVPIRGSDPRNAGAPEALFDTGLGGSVSYDDYTVAPDGRFLLRVPTGTEALAPIHVLLGWEAPAN